jgi:hypothetical protein
VLFVDYGNTQSSLKQLIASVFLTYEDIYIHFARHRRRQRKPNNFIDRRFFGCFVPFDGTQFENPLVTLSLMEAAQVIESKEALEKHDVSVQEEDARKIADALYDERIAIQIKTEMKSNEGETPKGSVYVSHIVSPGDFWIQHVEDEQNIGSFEDGLVEVGTSNQYLLSGPPIVGGQLYAAKHPEFGK